MAGTSNKDRKGRRNRKKGKVSVQYDCLLNLLPRDIWVRVATKVASNSIRDLFNMQATCKVFLDAASSDAVYKHASMLEVPIVSFLYYFDQTAKKFQYYCVEAGNPATLFRVGMIDFFWIGHCIGEMETLTLAATEGDVEACYVCAMLLLSNGKEDDEHMRRKVEFFEIVRDSVEVKRCKEIFKQVFEHRWMEVKPSDPGEPLVCQSSICPTRGTIGVVEDLSRVSCVQCLAEYEVRLFLELFTFK